MGLSYDKPTVARAGCHSLGEACDFLILVSISSLCYARKSAYICAQTGNNVPYGGLGREFTCVTPDAPSQPA